MFKNVFFWVVLGECVVLVGYIGLGKIMMFKFFVWFYEIGEG